MKKAWWECGRSQLEPYIPGVVWGQARASMAAKDQEGIQWLTGSGAGGPLFLLPMCVLVPQSCPALCDPIDCSPQGFSVHEILKGIFPTQGSNLDLPHCDQIYWLSHQGSFELSYFLVFP